MPTHAEQRTLPYSAEQLYALVADIERYPEFLPWCSAARVRSVAPQGDAEVMTADHVDRAAGAPFVEVFHWGLPRR